MPVCRFCEAEFVSDRECVQHTIIFHRFEPGFFLTCDVLNCPATFRVLSSYRSHRSRHKSSQEFAIPEQVPVVRNIEENNEDLNVGEVEDQIDAMDVDDCETMVDVSIQELAGKYLLYVRANSSMPQGVLLNTMALVETILSASVGQFAKELKENLVQQSVIPNDFELPIPESTKTFAGLHTIRRQDKYFMNSLNIIKPQSIDLNAPHVSVTGSSMSGNRAVKLKTPRMVYIPIIETLKHLLNDPSIARLMSDNQQGDPSWYDSFIDGKLFKNSQFFKDHPGALRLIFYYDDVELCEVLGSRSHAVGVLYMSLDNVPAKYRSRLQFIHLVAIAEKKDIHASGIDTFLEPAVLDVKKLERGVALGEGEDMLYACLIGFTADNLGSHGVGGFKEGFTAAHPCRTSMAPLLDVRTCIATIMFMLRTDESYQEQVRLLNEAPNKQRKTELSMEFGINRESILNKLEHFSVVKNPPPDAMHDILEGCFPITIKILLSKVIDDGVLSLEEINERIKDFDYGYSESKSKPAEIKSHYLELNGSLRQSASEMWQLGVILPIILGPDIDIDCDYWNVYLSLLQASMIIMARKISEDMLGYLQCKLFEYADGFLKHYRDTLIPKQHFLLHYVHYIEQYGPISQFWNMRMESRHQFFKRLAKKMKNFKNISLSLANRNQLWEASQRFTEIQKVDVTLCGEGSLVSSASCVYKDALPENWEYVIEVPYVEVNNLMLVASECCVATDFDYGNSLPVFALILTIIIKDNFPRFVCQNMNTVFFDSHMNAYQVELSETYVSIEFEDLFSEAVFHWHTSLGKKYIIVKRALGPLF